MENHYLTVMNSPTSKIERRRSVFKGYMAHVSNRDQINAFFNSVKSEHKSATHHVLAYTLYEGDVAYCCDDGEPSKTAGEPILNIIKKKAVFDVCVVVVRYFGGVLLGTGGLVEAYSSACSLLFKDVIYARSCLCSKLKLIVSYSVYSKIKFLFELYKVQVVETNFSEDVTVIFYLENSRFDELKSKIENFVGLNFSLKEICQERFCLQI